MQQLFRLFTFVILIAVSACQNQTKSTDTNTQESPPTVSAAAFGDGNHCYEMRIGQDVTNVKLVVNGNEVTGEMNWIPFEKDGGRGTLQGTRNGNEIVAIWSYVIEGSNQTEEVRFKIEGEQLLRKTGELVDANNDGNLKLKDPANVPYSERFTKISCP